MNILRELREIKPEAYYTVSEAARYLGIHRCTIYAYISHIEKPLPFARLNSNKRLVFHGKDLIAYKAGGFPKKGRKRKNGNV